VREGEIRTFHIEQECPEPSAEAALLCLAGQPFWLINIMKKIANSYWLFYVRYSLGSLSVLIHSILMAL
jgi:hypothetical protein